MKGNTSDIIDATYCFEKARRVFIASPEWRSLIDKLPDPLVKESPGFQVGDIVQYKNGEHSFTMTITECRGTAVSGVVICASRYSPMLGTLVHSFPKHRLILSNSKVNNI